MEVYTLLSASEGAPIPLEETTACVVIDVLRAMTTVVSALANGAAVVYPVKTVEGAFTRRENLRKSGVSVLLGGERNGFPPEGFDAGNSPSEYSEDAVTDRVVIFTTSNGTAAVEAMSAAPALAIAAFVNLSASADFVRERGGTVVLCCSGESGRPSYEDTVCAGGIANRLKDVNPVLDYSSIIASELYEREKDDQVGMMLNRAKHGRYLVDRGFESDISAAAAVDLYPVVVCRRADGGFYISR